MVCNTLDFQYLLPLCTRE